MTQLQDQLRLHLEHEFLWGTRELTTDIGGAPVKVPRGAQAGGLLILGDPGDLIEGAVRELLGKMVAAIGCPLETCRLAPWPTTPDQWAALLAPVPRGVLGFGPEAPRYLDAIPAGVPAIATHGPAHLTCRPEDKAAAWSALRSFRGA